MRILAPADYGLLGMAMIPIGLMHMMDELGMGSALIQKQTLERYIVEQVFALLLVFNGSVYLLLYFSAPAIGVFFEEPQLIPILRVLGLQLPLMSLSVIPDSMLRRKMDFRRKSTVVLISTIGHGLTALGLAAAGFGVWALVLGNLLAVVIRVIGLNIAAADVYWPRFRLTGMHGVIGFGGFVTADRLLWYFYAQSDVFIIGKMMGKELLGFYAVAMQLATLPMQKIQGILNEVGFAAFSRIQDDKPRIADYYLKATSMLSVSVFPVFLGISSVAPEIVDILLTEKWAPAVVPLQLLSLIVPLRMISAISTPALLGVGRPDVGVVNLIIACVIMPAAFFIGAHWGLNGVALAWVVAYPILFLIMRYRTLPVLGVKLSRHLSVLRGPAVSAILMGVTLILTPRGHCQLRIGTTLSRVVTSAL